MQHNRFDEEYENRIEEVFRNKVDNNKRAKKSTTSNSSKKKNKKGKKDMYNYGSREFFSEEELYYFNNGPAANQQLLTGDDIVNITLSESKRNRGYIFYMQKDLQSIYEKSGEHAYSNEFQVHYWFLNFRYKAPDNSIIDIAIPTCYFNYEQFVTSGHVDFELKDVGPLSEKVMPIHNMKVNELLAAGIDKKISAIFDDKLEFEAISVNFGTLHRHPGQSASQSFSNTDLNVKVVTERDALGIVFPLADAEDDKPSFSAIIALDGESYYSGGIYSSVQPTSKKTANLAHCEYRVANGKIQNELHYEKNRCISFNVIAPEHPSFVEKMFGGKQIRKTIIKYSNTDNSLFQKEIELLEIFEEIETSWSASTDLVLAENVKLPVQKNIVTAKKETTETATGGYLNTKKEENNVGDIGNTTTNEYKKHIATTPYDKYLLAKQELTKINLNLDYIKTVKHYISIESEQKYLQNLGLNAMNLKKLIDDYNTMSLVFYGKGHREEELRFYIKNATIDQKDLSDFLNENINMAAAINEEVYENISILKTYEHNDPELLASRHLYKNPFVENVANTTKEEAELKRDESYDAIADAEAEKKQTDEYVEKNTEPGCDVKYTLLSAVSKLLKG